MTEPTAAGFGHLVIRAGLAGLEPEGSRPCSMTS